MQCTCPNDNRNGVRYFSTATGSVHFAAGNQVLSLIKHLGHKLIIALSPASPPSNAENFPVFSSPVDPARLFRKSIDPLAESTVSLCERNTPDYFRRDPFFYPDDRIANYCERHVSQNRLSSSLSPSQ